MKSEIEKVIKEMKCGKASGNDDIATEMIKVLDDEGIKKITELCNLVYDTGYLPPDRSSSMFVTLPKKANATECSDYRTLSLMSHLLKILLKEYGLSPEIHIKRGVRQGCVLSPCLFNLYTENIFGAMNTNKGIKIGGTAINNLRYADDAVLLAETEEGLQKILNEVIRLI